MSLVKTLGSSWTNGSDRVGMLDFKCNSITIGNETPLKCRYVILFDFQIVFENQIVTLAKTEIIYPINVGALVAMNFT